MLVASRTLRNTVTTNYSRSMTGPDINPGHFWNGALSIASGSRFIQHQNHSMRAEAHKPTVSATFFCQGCVFIYIVSHEYAETFFPSQPFSFSDWNRLLLAWIAFSIFFDWHIQYVQEKLSFETEVVRSCLSLFRMQNERSLVLASMLVGWLYQDLLSIVCILLGCLFLAEICRVHCLLNRQDVRLSKCLLLSVAVDYVETPKAP